MHITVGIEATAVKGYAWSMLDYKSTKLSKADGSHVDVLTCSLCGAVVLDRKAHDEWHTQFVVIVK